LLASQSTSGYTHLIVASVRHCGSSYYIVLIRFLPGGSRVKSNLVSGFITPLGLLLAIAAIYLVSPSFTAAHFEVLSAQIHINAIAANEHRLGQANVLYPIHTEYFYLSRIGVVYLLQLSARIFGDGDNAFRAIIIGSFAIYIAASLVVARRYSGVSLRAALIAMLMTPGIVSLGFFFNDNVVSDAFALLGLAILPDLRVPWTLKSAAKAVAVGVLFGLAILARTDGFLILPVAFSLMLLETRNVRAIFMTLLCVSAGLCLAISIPSVLSGVNILQIYQIGRFFQQVHDDMPRGHVSMAMLVIIFLGLPNLMLLFIGGRINLRNKGPKRAIILALFPVLLAIFFASHALETRMFFPLLGPYVAMHAGQGLEWIVKGLPKPRPMAQSGAPVLLAILIVWFLPPISTPNKEGPRPIVGQFWSPLLWMKWQHAQQAQLDEADLPLRGSSARVVVATLNYTTDAFLRLRLWQTGYRPIAIKSAAPACQPDFEAWQKGDRVVYAVRTENPHQFVREPHDYIEAAELAAAFKCKVLQQGEPVYAFGSGVDTVNSAVAQFVKKDIPALVPTEFWLGWPPGPSIAISERLPSNFYEPMTIVYQHIVPLSNAQLTGLIGAADRELVRQREISVPPPRPLAEIRREWGFHFWHPSGPLIATD